jgi:hypothetical protein
LYEAATEVAVLTDEFEVLQAMMLILQSVGDISMQFEPFVLSIQQADSLKWD